MFDPANKVSTARRWGDTFEQRLLEVQALRLLTDDDVIAVFHEHRDANPADDIVVQRKALVEGFQAKHAANPHGLLTYEQFVGTDKAAGESIVTAAQLFAAWTRLRAKMPNVVLHVYTNRAADAELARMLDGTRVKPDLVLGMDGYKTKKKQIAFSCGDPPEADLKLFLEALTFELRSPGLDGMRSMLREIFDTKLGIEDPSMIERYIQFIEQRFHERSSLPISREQVLRALQLDRPLIPQQFPVDRRTLVQRTTLSIELRARLVDPETSYIALVGPPGSGKSTFLTSFGDQLAAEPGFAVLRYYSYVAVLDPQQSERVALDTFLRGLIEQIWLKYGHHLVTERRYEYSVSRLNKLVLELADALSSHGQKLVFIFDGLDHAASAQGIPDHLKYIHSLPSALPKNAVCILGTQGTSFLSANIVEHLRNRTLSMPLFSKEETSRCFSTASGVSLRDGADVAHLQAVTEGLPLYVRYVAEYAKSRPDQKYRELAEHLPAHAGHIENYYIWLWGRGLDNSTTKRACALLARLRFTLPESEFSRLLGADAFAAEDVFNRVRHLLGGGSAAVKIFHNSFRQFVEAKLSRDQISAVDAQILEHLHSQRWTANWFAHSFAYAASAGRDDLLREYVGRAYVTNAIRFGRSHEEIQRSLLTAFDRAVVNDDLELAASAARCLTDATIRLQYELNQSELNACIAGTKEGVTAGDRVLESAAQGEKIEASVSTLVALARQGHADTCRTIAEATLAGLFTADRLQSRDDVDDVLRLGCAYDAISPIWVLDRASSSDPEHARALLRTTIRMLGEFGYKGTLRELRKAIERCDEYGGLRQHWLLEDAYFRAERGLPGAAAAVRAAIPAVRERSDHVLVAGWVARLDLGKPLAASLLGMITLPDLDAEQVRWGVTRRAFQEFRAYVAAVLYLERQDEIAATAVRVRDRPSWLAHYYLLNLKVVQLFAERAIDGRADRTRRGLELIDLLADKTKSEHERIYEVFAEIRSDLPRWFDLVLDVLIRDGASADDIAAALRRFSESEIANTHYGFGMVVADYDVELGLLEVMDRRPFLHEKVLLLLQALKEKISTNTTETATRASHFFRLGTVAGRCGWPVLARECLENGVIASGGYGHRKDNTLDLLIDASKVAAGYHWFEENDWAEMATWAHAMDEVTDGKGTKWDVRSLFERVVAARPTRALSLLEAIQSSSSEWKFSDCLAIFLQRGLFSDSTTAYLLSELIDECDDRNGFNAKIEARLSILSEEAKKRSGDVALIASLCRGFLTTTIASETRAKFTSKFNEIASRVGVPLLDVAKDAPVASSDGATTHRVSDDQLLKGGDGSPIRPEDVARLVDGNLAAFEKFAALVASHDVSIYYREAMQPIGTAILASLTSGEEVSRLAQAWMGAIREDSTALFEIASAYVRVGDTTQADAYVTRAFESFHGWGLWDKRLEFLDSVALRNRAQPLAIVLRTIRDSMARHGNAFGADLLLLRAAHRFASDRQEVVHAIYAGSREHLRARFRHLSLRLPSFADVFRPDRQERPFVEVALGMVRLGWREASEDHRRRALLALLVRLGESQPATWISFAVSVASDEVLPARMRVDALHALVALLKYHAAHFGPYLETLRSLNQWRHFEARSLLAQILAILEPSTQMEWDVSTGTVVLAPGIRASTDFTKKVIGRALRSVADTPRRIAAVLSLDEGELLWRVERELHGMESINLDDIRERDRMLARNNIHPQGLNYSSVPFEPIMSAVLQMAINAVLFDICPPALRPAVLRLLRTRDEWPSWCWVRQTPDDLIKLELLSASTNVHPRVSSPGLDGLLWIPVFDEGCLSRAGGTYYFHRRAVLASSAQVAGLSPTQLRELVEENVLRLGKRDVGAYSGREIRELANGIRSRGSLHARDVVPFIAVHFGRLLSFEESDAAVLPGYWMNDLGLKWSDDRTLELVEGVETRVQTFRWQEGHAAALYKYRSLGEGVRMTVHRALADRLKAERGLSLVILTEVDRGTGFSDEPASGEPDASFRVDVV